MAQHFDIGTQYINALITGDHQRLSHLRNQHSIETIVGAIWDALVDIADSELVIGNEPRFSAIAEIVATPNFYAKTFKSNASRKVHQLANGFLNALLDALRDDLAAAGPCDTRADENRPIFSSGVRVSAGPNPTVDATSGNKHLSFPASISDPPTDHVDAVAAAMLGLTLHLAQDPRMKYLKVRF